MKKFNLHISSNIAAITGEKRDYIKQRRIDDKYYQKMIVEYLEKFN